MAAAIIAILFSFDLITSIIAAAHLDQKLGELEAMRADFIQNLEKSRLYQAKSELHTSLCRAYLELRLSEITDRMRTRIETYRTETQDTVGRIARKEELEALFRSFAEKYAKNYILKAYPSPVATCVSQLPSNTSRPNGARRYPRTPFAPERKQFLSVIFINKCGMQSIRHANSVRPFFYWSGRCFIVLRIIICLQRGAKLLPHPIHCFLRGKDPASSPKPANQP